MLVIHASVRSNAGYSAHVDWQQGEQATLLVHRVHKARLPWGGPLILPAVFMRDNVPEEVIPAVCTGIESAGDDQVEVQVSVS